MAFLTVRAIERFLLLTTQECVRGDAMPVVVVEMWQGRTEEQKAKLIKGITKAFEDIGVPADRLHIIIHDVPKCNWGTCGEPASKMKP
jgi:4-oxalocrotonate tautomerase